MVRPDPEDVSDPEREILPTPASAKLILMVVVAEELMFEDDGDAKVTVGPTLSIVYVFVTVAPVPAVPAPFETFAGVTDTITV